MAPAIGRFLPGDVDHRASVDVRSYGSRHTWSLPGNVTGHFMTGVGIGQVLPGHIMTGPFTGHRSLTGPGTGQVLPKRKREKEKKKQG
ncbi:hypothetical protein DPMN_165119 [Dreissena polymorpha]|uniref:Uncharacterized protein n=1 Tax=Dreissena polymorpha TaxID=45954 RepID=A0A9D4EUS7_DREPO|nr:hypothetical protein DPMN_165119 [Dreissena polymorpha]